MSNETPVKKNSGRFMLTAACFVVVVAGMRTASPIMVPFLLSIFIAIICAPALYWLQRLKVPSGLAVLLILIAILGISTAVGALVGNSVNDFISDLPSYQTRLAEKKGELIQWLASKGVDTADDFLNEHLNLGTAMGLIGDALKGLRGALTNVFMILLTVVFILLEAGGFSKKMRVAFDDPEESLAGFTRFTDSVNRYLGIKTVFSATTGILIWIWLSILGVDYAVLWGLIAFLLNYVPNIGSIIAAIPAVLLALIQLGVGAAILTGGGYIVVNVLLGSILEPRFMGRGLGLSTLVVFLSLVFWGWVLGPVGMLLSVPLTMISKIALESNEDTKWIAVLLGS